MFFVAYHSLLLTPAVRESRQLPLFSALKMGLSASLPPPNLFLIGLITCFGTSCHFGYQLMVCLKSLVLRGSTPVGCKIFLQFFYFQFSFELRELPGNPPPVKMYEAGRQGKKREQTKQCKRDGMILFPDLESHERHRGKLCERILPRPLRFLLGRRGIHLPGPYTGFNDGRGPRPNFRRRGGAKAPKSQNFPQNHKGPPLCATRDLRFREGAMAPLPPLYTGLPFAISHF